MSEENTQARQPIHAPRGTQLNCKTWDADEF